MQPQAATLADSPPHADAARPGPPRELALPGMHAHVMRLIAREVPPGPDVRVLDAGAGQGSLSAKLLEAGYDTHACDLYPEMFRVPGVECRPADASGGLPYSDERFDLVASIEVVEHLDGHGRFFSEVCRVLRPGGALILTTPNMQSLKSRLRFLSTGYYYSFGPLNPDEFNPVSQHISPFSVDRYRFMLGRAGLTLTAVATDKYQKSSLALAGLMPIVRLCTRLKFGRGEGARLQNSRAALFGRTLFLVARKPGGRVRRADHAG